MSRYKYLLFLPLFLFVAGCSSGDEKKSDKKESEKPAEAGKITANHIKLPYSNMYIVPPAGFALDTMLHMLQKYSDNGYSANFTPMQLFMGKTAASMISELKTESEKKTPGAWTEEEVTVSGHPAKICSYGVLGSVKQYYLYFTDGSTNDMLVANYDSKNGATGKQMFNAMKTVVIEKKSD